MFRSTYTAVIASKGQMRSSSSLIFHVPLLVCFSLLLPCSEPMFVPAYGANCPSKIQAKSKRYVDSGMSFFLCSNSMQNVKLQASA